MELSIKDIVEIPKVEIIEAIDSKEKFFSLNNYIDAATNTVILNKYEASMVFIELAKYLGFNITMQVNMDELPIVLKQIKKEETTHVPNQQPWVIDESNTNKTYQWK